MQQDLYQHNENEKEESVKDVQSKLKQSLLISESEFVKISPESSIEESHATRTRSTERTRAIPDDQHSSNRYSEYDNRPVKPLDQNILQSKVNQYPQENMQSNISRPRTSTQPTKVTPREPIIMRPKSHKPSSTRIDQTKRHTIAAVDTTTKSKRNKFSSSEGRSNHDEEFQPKSAPINTAANSAEMKKLSASIETIRTSVLQA